MTRTFERMRFPLLSMPSNGFEVDVVYGHAALVNSSGLVLQVLWAPRNASRLMRIHDFVASRQSSFVAGRWGSSW